MTPREELEARLTALLLGELSADEAAALRQQLAQDAELTLLHDRLQQAIALVRETVAAPEHEAAALADAPKLAPERREKLLATFKVVPAEKLKRARRLPVNWREWAALAAMVVGLLGVAGVLMNQFIEGSNEGETGRGLFGFEKRLRAMTVLGSSGPVEAEQAVDLAYARATAQVAAQLRARNPATPASQAELLNDSGFTASLWGGQTPPVDNKIQISGQALPALESGRLGKSGNFAAYLGEAQQALARQAGASAQSAEDTMSVTMSRIDGRFGELSRDVQRQSALDVLAPATFAVATRPPPMPSEPAPAADPKNSGEGRGRHFAGIALPARGDSLASDDGRASGRLEGDRAIRQSDLSGKDYFFETAADQKNAMGRPVTQGGSGPGSGSAEYASVSVARTGGAHGGGGFGGMGGGVDFITGSPGFVFRKRGADPAAAPHSGLVAGRDFTDLNRNGRWDVNGLSQDDVGGRRFLRAPSAPAPVPVPVAPFVNQGMITANPVAADDGGVWYVNGTVAQGTTPTPAKPASASGPQAVEVVRRRVDSLDGWGGIVVRTNGAAGPATVSYFDTGVSAAPAQQLASRSDKTLGDIALQVVMETQPASILAGDRNAGRSTAPIDAVNTWNEPTAKPASAWDTTILKSAGNIGLGDGSAQQVAGTGLQKQITSQLQAGGNAMNFSYAAMPESAASGTAPAPVAGPGAVPPAGRNSFANRINNIVSRAASGPGEADKKDNPLSPTPTAEAGGVHSVNAVGFQTAGVNDPAANLGFGTGRAPVEKALQAVADFDGDGISDQLNASGTITAGEGFAVTKGMKPGAADGSTPKPVLIDAKLADVGRDESKDLFRFGLQPATGLPAPMPVARPAARASGKATPTEGEKLSEITKAPDLGDMPVIGGLFRNPEGRGPKDFMKRDLSSLDAEKKLKESTDRRAGRVEIALPQGERGEALEKQRVAVGPLVINEVMYNPPNAANLPADEFVALVTNTSTLPTAAGLDYTVTVIDGQQSDDQSALADAAMRTAGLESLNRQLETSLAVRERLQSRVWQEKVDQAMPKNATVEIIDKAAAQDNETITYVMRLTNALAKDAIEVIRPFAKTPNNVMASADGRSLVLRDSPEATKRMAELVRQIDTAPVQEFDSVVIPIQSAKAGDVAKALDSLTAGGGGGGTTVGRSQANTGLSTGGGGFGNTGGIGGEAGRNTFASRINDIVARAAGPGGGGGDIFVLGQTKIIADERVNSLLVFASKADLATISNIISKLDPPAPKLAAGAGVPQPEVATAENAFSTFSLNVSDVSFKLAAASLEKGQMPDPATVRSEEFINAFDYRDPEPKGSAPIAFAWERARYPFAHDRDLLRFSVKTAASGRQPGRPLNLVLLLDNSGSMERADRVRIRQECLRVLAGQLRPEDRVSVVAFARTARLWVDGLPGNQAGELPQRVGTLAPEGGTNLEEAMNVAYQTALKHFLANGVNRVVLLTDGAANLGDVQPESLKKKVEAHRQQGVALDCFGIGWDGLNDELLEALSRNGDGRYGFVNTPEAATSEFAAQLAGALKVAASDVKVQVEWNPRRVTAYRQIGYAKHQLKKEQFRDNTVDAAEIGAAEAGNALYTVQVNPRGEGPLGTVRVRFKVPGTSDYREHEWPLAYDGSAKSLDQSSPALRLAASASAFSEWLVSSPFAAEVTPDKLLGYLSGVPETCPADPRPKKLEWMIRQAKSVAGK